MKNFILILSIFAMSLNSAFAGYLKAHGWYSQSAHVAGIPQTVSHWDGYQPIATYNTVNFVVFADVSASSYGQAYAQVTFITEDNNGYWTYADSWYVNYSHSDHTPNSSINLNINAGTGNHRVSLGVMARVLSGDTPNAYADANAQVSW
jgi:hypothetical protein